MKELHLYLMWRQVTTVNNTVFITYPMGELFIVGPVASLYNRTFSSWSINVNIIKLENKYEVGSLFLIPDLVSVSVNVSIRIVNQKPRTRNQFRTDTPVLCYNLTSCFPHKQLDIQYLALFFAFHKFIKSLFTVKTGGMYKVPHGRHL